MSHDDEYIDGAEPLQLKESHPLLVMAGLVPAIHVAG